jgi:hypothetical protein
MCNKSIICGVLFASGAITCYVPSCGFYGPYTMDRNNYIEIHPTQAQVAKISYHHPSKCLNQNVSPQLQYLLFRIMCLFSEKWVCKQVLNYHNLLCGNYRKGQHDKVWNSTNFWPVPRNFNFYLVCFRIYMILDVPDNFAF